MAPSTIRGNETSNEERLEILATISDENTLRLTVENGHLASFSSLLQQGIPMTACVLNLMFESWSNRGSEFSDAWLRVGGNLNDFYDGCTPLK